MMTLQKEVRDLGLAAALITAGFPMTQTSRTHEGRVNFLFDETPELLSATDDYWNDSLEVAARTYMDNIKALKSQIYGGK